MPTGTLVSQSWELVYFDSELTEGSTDFEALSVEKRVEFLHHYAEKAKSWFKDPLLESFVASEEEISEALAGLKEPPSPTVRKRRHLKAWKYTLEIGEEPFWQDGFDDSAWMETEVPKLFSPLTAQGNLRLRNTFEAGDFKTAMLVVESLADYSRVWANGTLLRDTTVGITGRSDGRYEPFRIDLSNYLVVNSENVIAIEVLRRTEKLRYTIDEPVESCNEAFGVAGDICLDLTDDEVYITEAFLRAVDVADPCTVKASLTLVNLKEASARAIPDIRQQERSPAGECFNGTVEIGLYEWFPNESGQAAAVQEMPVSLLAGGSEIIHVALRVPSPKVWTPDEPCLYHARIVVKSEDGTALDDCVETFGIRTIKAPDNHLYFNGRKFFAKGCAHLNRFPPLSEAKLNMVCPPDRAIMRDLLAFKKTNGKILRVIARYKGTNSSRMLDICDQLGVALEWLTMAHRDYSHVGGIEAAEAVRRVQLPASIKHVRNHPSIIVWEGSNELGPVNKALFWDDFYRAVRALDDNRLIDPVSELQRMSEGVRPDSWQADEVVWGYHTYSGWYTPFAPIAHPTEDKVWFHDEGDRHWYKRHLRPIIHSELGAEAMPKWSLYADEPWHKIWDFKDADKFEAARIGRNLDRDTEWEESQAYQGLVLQSFITSLRMSSLDGAYVCCLSDGFGSGKFHKGVLDAYGRAKIGFHTVRMSFDDVLTSALRGKIVLGAEDALEPKIVNDGEGQACSLQVDVVAPSGEIVDTKVYKNVTLDGETAVTPLPGWKPSLGKSGYYFLEYRVFSERRV